MLYVLYVLYALYMLYGYTRACDHAWTLYGRSYSAYMHNSIQPHIQRAAHLRCEEVCVNLDTR